MTTVNDALEFAKIAATSPEYCQFDASGFDLPAIEMFIRKYILERPSTPSLILVLSNEKKFYAWQKIMFSLADELGIKHVATLPAINVWGLEGSTSHTSAAAQRIHALHVLTSAKPSIILTTLAGMAQNTLSRADFNSLVRTLKIDQELDLDELIKHLKSINYLQRATVEEEGQFAVRGGVLDIYSPNYVDPLRLEFFGDQLVSIRLFSVDSQRSQSQLKHAELLPMLEIDLLSKDRNQRIQPIYDLLLNKDIPAPTRDGLVSTFLSGYQFNEIHTFAPLLRDSSEQSLVYIPKTATLIFPEGRSTCEQAYHDAYQNFHDEYAKIASFGNKPTIAPSSHFVAPQQIQEALDIRYLKINFSALVSNKSNETTYQLRLSQDVAMPSPTGVSVSFETWTEYFQTLFSAEKNLIVLSESTEHHARLIALFEHRGITLFSSKHLSALLAAGTSRDRNYLATGTLSGPTWINNGVTLVIPESTLFGQERVNRAPRKTLKNYLSSFRDLRQGDLVVHIDHGIGRYIGMSTLQAGGSQIDCLQVEYAGGDRIYVPVDRLSLLQKYSRGDDGEGKGPSLDKLKGLGWEKRKAGAKKAIRDLTEQLLKLQAQRATSPGLAFSPPTDDYRKFEAGFPYIETEDQLKAISEVNADLERDRPMDRLVCGDVGFGKTEVALRAAFRAVSEGYQVAVLVPTTVLCYQHFQTFHQRMQAFGIRVDQVNRFVSSKAIKNKLRAIEDGQLDIIIGTHRLLSKDVKFKSLGLLIVDEEQRFGVTHKEALKELRANCHVLTLTATPIPRTLHMAMLGLRDISIIATPPLDRMSIKTYITKFDEHMLKESIENELARGGQVFVVHNKVQDLVELRNKIKRLLPQAEIGIAHGQMQDNQLEKVIVDFIDKKFSILICTTIIESGIDMPNVNTLLVNNAHHFGLAQLYQIRGRVGRSTKQGYAFFMVPDPDRLNDEAKKRLEVLSSNQELGSGFRIARYDLEIRGAGNLLGGEQSGNMAEIGLELYTEMLEQAIAETKGEKPKERIDSEIKINFAALIPHSYLDDEVSRLDLYKKLFSISHRNELDQVSQEIKDRYGAPPAEVLLLIEIANLKWMLQVCRALSLSINHHGLAEARFTALSAEQITAITKTAAADPRSYHLSPDFRLLMPIEQEWSTIISKQRILVKELMRKLEPFVNELERQS